MLSSSLSPEAIPEQSSSAFRDLVAALRLGNLQRILDVGAGGFVGEVTTQYLLELFPEAALTAVELDADRAEKLRERFGERIEVVTGDIREVPLNPPFDLVAVDLDSGAIPLIYEDLLDGVIARVTRPGGAVVALVMTSHEQAFYGPKAFPSGAEFHEEFMHRRFGTLALTDAGIKEHFAGNPRYDALVLVDKWRNDPANFIGWVALRRTLEPAVGDTALPSLRGCIDAGDVTPLDLVGDTTACGPDCPELLQRWSAWARSAFGGWYAPDDLGIATVPDDAIVPAVPLALLERPPDMPAYHQVIGAKSRNMLRKAARNGFTYEEFDYNTSLDDIFEVNTSKAERQGQLMTAGYLERPRPNAPHRGCPRHQVVWLGGFRDGRLCAYVRLVVLNDLAVVSQFLGHGDELRFGVMNGLVEKMVRFLLDRTNARAIDYLTLRSTTETLDRFKRSVGFRERAVVLSVAS